MQPLLSWISGLCGVGSDVKSENLDMRGGTSIYIISNSNTKSTCFFFLCTPLFLSVRGGGWVGDRESAGRREGGGLWEAVEPQTLPSVPRMCMHECVCV